MPEGDTLYRIASNVRPALQGREIVAARSNASPSVTAVDAASLVGSTVTEVEARGKHLLVSFDDGRVVHSHLGMTGSWHVYPAGESWNKPERQAGLVLRTAAHNVVNFNPKQLRIVSYARIRRDHHLARLGPDLMRAGVELEAILPRIRVHNAAPIGEAVMNQTIAAGIGNIYKSETLFLARINPWTRVRELTDERLLDYLRLAHRLMRLNRGTGMRTTRFRNDGQRHWVYGRRGEPCFECGGVITLRRQGDAGRTTYWCANCQPATLVEPRLDASH